MSKDIYLDEVERIASLLEEQGMSPGKAFDRANEMAYDAMRERLADMADDAKARSRG